MVFDEIKSEILAKLDLKTEFEALGIKLIGEPSASGWIKCKSPFNGDNNPSCGVCVDPSSKETGYLKIFNGSGPRSAINFFDLAKELSPVCAGKNFVDILKFYADQSNVSFDNQKKNKNIPFHKKIIKTYDYIDLAGDLKYQVCRLEPKRFCQRRPDRIE